MKGLDPIREAPVLELCEGHVCGGFRRRATPEETDVLWTFIERGLVVDCGCVPDVARPRLTHAGQLALRIYRALRTLS